MKLKSEMSLERVRLGSIEVGGLFYHDRRFWIIVNAVAPGRRLIRAMATDTQDPHVIGADTSVHRVKKIRVKK
jgi:hypothetical protein